MSNRRLRQNQGEWADIIKAQDEISKKLLEAEQDLQKQSKILYKQELDKQLKIKSSLNQVRDLKNDERSFQIMQNLAMKDFDTNKKLNDRSIMQIIQSSNQEDLQNKHKQLEFLQNSDKIIEQQQLKKVQQDLLNEKMTEIEQRNKRIQAEQDEIQRINMEKMLKIKEEDVERVKDRKMIEKNIEQMKMSENAYKEFYERKVSSLEKKAKGFRPSNEKKMMNQEVIIRKNEEWQAIERARQEELERFNEINKAKSVLVIKSELERQMDDRNRVKAMEIQDNKQYLLIAKNKALEEKAAQDIERSKRLQEREDLKITYEKQLKDKETEMQSALKMSKNEANIHNKMIENLKNNKIVAFMGVPGSHNIEPPIQQSLNRAYGDRSGLNDSNLDIRKFSLTPPPLFNSSRSSDKNLSNKYLFPNPYKHDPITNPIGSEMPKLSLISHINKGMGSHSRLAMAGNSLFK